MLNLIKIKKMNSKIARADKRRCRAYLRKHSDLPVSLIRVLPYRMLKKLSHDIYLTICESYDYDEAPPIPTNWIVGTLDWTLKRYIYKYLHKTFSSTREFYKYCNREYVEYY